MPKRYSLAVLLWIAACGTIDKLRPEQEIPELRDLGVKANGLERPPVMVRSDAYPDRTPVEVAVHKFGDRDGDRVIVAIHGVLSDHLAWRYVVGALGGTPEVWAVDLPGCGDSDKPKPGEEPEDTYSPTWMARHVMSVLAQQLEGRKDTRVTVLAHSLGGAVALRMLSDPANHRDYKDVLDRIDGAVLLAPLSFGLRKEEEKPAFRTLAKITDVELGLGEATGLLKKQTTEAVYGSTSDPERKPIPSEERDRMHAILDDPARAHAVKYQLRRALPRDKDDEVDETARERLILDYRNVDVPCLILWGEEDKTLPVNSALAITVNVPTWRMRLVKQAMHSFQIEEPRLCADMIREFLDKPLAEWPQGFLRVGYDEPRGERKLSTTAQKESVSTLRRSPVESAPSSVTVVPNKTVTRSGARYLADNLRMVPGVEVQRLSSTESSVAFRGFIDTSTAAQGTMGLVDGRQVYNYFLGNVLWDQIAVRQEDVKRVEVVRGPSSFIHGPNAMHGLVDILTRSALDYEEDHVSLIAHAGSYDSVVAGATLVNRTRYTGFKISTQWDDIGQFDNDRGNTRDKGFADAQFEVQLDGEPDKVLGLSAGYSTQLFDLLLPQLEVIPPTTAANDSRELYFKADFRSGKADDMALKVMFWWTGFDDSFTPGQYYEPFKIDLDTVNLDAHASWMLSSHFVTGGAGGRFSTFATEDNDVADGRHSVSELWIFAQDVWKVTKAFSLTFGARVDFHSVAGANVSARIAAVWKVLRNQHLRASAGRGLRNPSLRELWLDMQITDVPGVAPAVITVSGNTSLRAESLTSFELGWFGTWGSIVETKEKKKPGAAIVVDDPGLTRRQFEFGVTGFYNLIDDLISFTGDPTDPLRVLPVNQEDEIAYGAELEARYVFEESFSAFANFSYVRRENRQTGEQSLDTPGRTVNAGVTFARSGFNVMLWANYRDSSEQDGVPVDSYVLVNGSVAYEFPWAGGSRGQVFLRFFNLLDDEHKEHPNGDTYGLILTGGLQIEW
jgi:iron complex outermembrane receptor protein